MKYTLSLALIALLSIGIASCSNETTTNNMDSLPSEVRNIVNNNFNANVVSVTTENAAIGVEEYEILLDDGTKVTFGGTEWDEVEMPLGQSVPEYFVMAPIKNYVDQKHPGQTIVEIDRDKKGYEIELANGTDIKFDLNGTFISYD